MSTWQFIVEVIIDDEAIEDWRDKPPFEPPSDDPTEWNSIQSLYWASTKGLITSDCVYAGQQLPDEIEM